MSRGRADTGCRAGFTLMEGVVALAILGAVSAASLGAVSASVRAMDRAHHALVSSELAADRLAALRLLAPEDLSPLPDSLRGGTFGPELEGYSWRAEVRSSTSDPALFEATVTVRWDRGSETLQTLLPARNR